MHGSSQEHPTAPHSTTPPTTQYHTTNLPFTCPAPHNTTQHHNTNLAFTFFPPPQHRHNCWMLWRCVGVLLYHMCSLAAPPCLLPAASKLQSMAFHQLVEVFKASERAIKVHLELLKALPQHISKQEVTVNDLKDSEAGGDRGVGGGSACWTCNRCSACAGRAAAWALGMYHSMRASSCALQHHGIPAQHTVEQHPITGHCV
jgi:hypothetical protein